MINKKHPDVKLIITVALRKEIPVDWFTAHNVPVQTLAALKSGALSKISSSRSGMFIMVTGSGLKAGEEAACWIRDNLKPLFVVNIGTCGLTDKRHSPGTWIRPRFVANEEDDQLELDTRLPIPCPENITDVHSLISVRKAQFGNLSAFIKKHDAIDMECYIQAKVFSETDVSFHCLKFGTDYADMNTHRDFNRNLESFKKALRMLFDFLVPVTALTLPPSPGGDTEGSIGKSDEYRIAITAIVPVYNREHTVKRAIGSIVSQTYKPEEIIVIDDCSRDKTGSILEGYGDNITLIRLPENSGPSKARNEGIQRAQTEWIAFMDSDDCWDKDKLKNQAAYLQRYPFYQIMQSEEIWIRRGVRVNPRKHHGKPEGWIFEPSLERCLVSPSAVLARKSLIEKNGCFDESLPVCEDYDLWLKIARHHPFGLDPGLSVIKFGGHRDQLSRKYFAMDRFRVQSLVRLLENEHSPYFREKIVETLERKLKILIRGYEKRQKLHEALECRETLESLCCYYEKSVR